MKSGSFRKAVSLTLIASMCASLAACQSVNESTVTDTSETTTEATTATTSTETTESSETEETSKFSQDYAYTIYEDSDNPLTLSMGVNIDDYISQSEDGEVFELFKLASDLGWLEKGLYTYEDYEAATESDPDQKRIGHSNWYSYSYDDHRAVFIINEYIDNIPDSDRRQVSLISFEYMKNEFTLPYFEDADSNYAHNKVVLGFDYHYDDDIYFVGGQRSMCSREDAIVIAYTLWVMTNSPDDSTDIQQPFEPFRDDFYGILLP